MHWNSDKLSDGRRNGVNYGFQVTNTDTVYNVKTLRLSEHVMHGLVGLEY